MTSWNAARVAAAVRVVVGAADAHQLAPDGAPEGMESLLHSLFRGNGAFLSRLLVSSVT